MAIIFFSEGIDFKLAKPRIKAEWIKRVIKKEKKRLDSITYVFCSDAFLAKMNQDYLQHRAFTDIITFDLSNSASLAGEIYISVERVRENAERFQEPFEREIKRVLIHGVLHLIGYNDKTAAEKALMRKKEEAYLSLR